MKPKKDFDNSRNKLRNELRNKLKKRKPENICVLHDGTG
jgi:hypothetical protein